jgi:DNA-binding transcriptional LysR family regulator
VESQVGVAIMPASAARRHAQTLAIETVTLADDWAPRHMQICMRSQQALPAFAQDLVALLVEDAARDTPDDAAPVAPAAASKRRRGG